MKVNAWIEKVIIPTYGIGKDEPCPMFLEKRVYQGSSGVVYPHPIIEKIEDTKKDKEYEAVFLENEYLKIMILPQLGGRIQKAYDKIHKRDFVYYNQVIKPALVGLTGPWISGGIEFNWPQHHRPSTFLPVDFTIEENNDGSQTVWINEMEIMFRTKGRAGFTLYPDKAYLEIKGRLFNRTPFPQTFLWWANPAVKVNEHYQSVFPPDVYAVFDHGKRDVSDFPIATGTYYKVNYAPGTDISRYDTIPVPTSYMAIKSDYDFIGCYEHDTQGGMLHVANHHFSPGKKQWTWGNGDFGYAWDKNLTDQDGPYIELMTGVFTDNQPDFSWLYPNEEKTFEQYFMPYSQIGIVKNATKEAMLNLEIDKEKITIKVYTTALYQDAIIELYANDKLFQFFKADLSPKNIFKEIIRPDKILSVEEYKVIVKHNNTILVFYQPKKEIKKETPPPASPAKKPSEIEHIEDLYLNGLHLEQYRHATYNPIEYYEEGLRRNPEDIRCNNAMGLLLLRRGQFAKAELYFKKAIETLLKRNPNPIDGEPYYNLGLALKLQNKLTEAYGSFYKATWNDAWQHSAFLELARIATMQHKYADALELIEKSLIRNYHSHTARHLKASILRHLNITSQNFIDESLTIDLFNYGCLYENYLLAKKNADNKKATTLLQQLQTLMHNNLNNYLELSLDYANTGLYQEALDILNIYTAQQNTTNAPIVYYYMAYYYANIKDTTETNQYYKSALETLDKEIYFPNKIEEILILQKAISHNPKDTQAHYYLGNLWYDKRQYTDAIACWEKAVEYQTINPIVYRNLAIAYYNKLGKKEQALKFMERAFTLNENNARIFMELDQLYKLLNYDFNMRLDLLQKHIHLIQERDDLYLEYITLLNSSEQFNKASELLDKRKFHPWEGGEGKVIGQFLLSNIEQAKHFLVQNKNKEAIEILERITQYPENLGEGKLYGAQENDIHYLLGCAYQSLNKNEQAQKYFELATQGISEPVQAIYYNDPQPDKIFYQALAWLKLKQKHKAKEIFERLLKFGQVHIKDNIQIDYFAVSLPDMLVFDIDLNQRNLIHCEYLMGLGLLGLGDFDKAIQHLNKVIALNKNHQGAFVYLNMINFIKSVTAE